MRHFETVAIYVKKVTEGLMLWEFTVFVLYWGQHAYVGCGREDNVWGCSERQLKRSVLRW